jgi:hypothetical protein
MCPWCRGASVTALASGPGRDVPEHQGQRPPGGGLNPSSSGRAPASLLLIAFMKAGRVQATDTTEGEETK